MIDTLKTSIVLLFGLFMLNAFAGADLPVNDAATAVASQQTR